MYQNDPMKVLTGEVRLSYVSVVTPRAPKQGGEAKYSVTLLIPKSDIATKADIDQSMQAAAQEAISKTWNGVQPPNLRVPIYDGDGVRPSGEPFGEECKGCWVMTASSKMKPEVVDISNINVQLSPSDIYSGMWARVTIRFFGYSNSGNKGIGCGLGNIMKTRNDEPLAGNAPASSDFAGVGNAVAPPQPPNVAQPPWGAQPRPPAYPQYPQQPQAPAYGQPQPPAYPQPPQQPQAPAYGQHPVNINPLTGQPM